MEQQPVNTVETPVTEEVKVEGQEAEKVEEKPQEDLKSKRFAELSKREQKLLRKELEMKARLKEREEGLTKRELEIKEAAKRELMELAKKDPVKALQELGTDYNQLTEWQLNEGKLTPEKVNSELMNKIQELEKKLESTHQTIEQKEAQKRQEENERILNNFSASIVETVKNSADKYPAVHTFDGAPIIYEMIQQRWHDTNGQHLMSIHEAAEILEKELSGKIDKLLTTQKYASRVIPQPKGEKVNSSLNKSKTITNELTSSAPSMLPAKTENDRIKRALEKLQA